MKFPVRILCDGWSTEWKCVNSVFLDQIWKNPIRWLRLGFGGQPLASRAAIIMYAIAIGPGEKYWFILHKTIYITKITIWEAISDFISLFIFFQTPFKEITWGQKAVYIRWNLPMVERVLKILKLIVISNPNPNDLIFWLRSQNQNLLPPYFLKKMILTNCYRVGDPPVVGGTLCHCVADRCR